MEEKNNIFLLSLARRTIEEYSRFGTRIAIQEADLPFQFVKTLLIKQGVFVTLTKNYELRGCVGSLIGQKSLYQEVIDNAINAGFNDYRFSRLRLEELPDIKIEISILSPLTILKQPSSLELVRWLGKKKPGIYLKLGNNSATFLPQVWEEIKTPSEFLSQLCIKAGLKKNDWQNSQMNFWYYNVESFKEN